MLTYRPDHTAARAQKNSTGLRNICLAETRKLSDNPESGRYGGRYNNKMKFLFDRPVAILASFFMA